MQAKALVRLAEYRPQAHQHFCIQVADAQHSLAGAQRRFHILSGVWGPTGNRRFWGSERPRLARKPIQWVGRFAASRLDGFSGWPAAQTPKVDDFRSALKSLKNQLLKTQV